MLYSDFLVPYVGTNLVAVALLAAAFWRPYVALLAFVLLFVAAAITNTVAALGSPEIYVDGYGPVALIGIYREFIYGYFARHTQAIILTIAAAQLAIGIVLMYRGRLRTIGIAGAVTFLLGIAPLGVGSGFPATLLMAAALLVLGRCLSVPGLISRRGAMEPQSTERLTERRRSLREPSPRHHHEDVSP